MEKINIIYSVLGRNFHDAVVKNLNKLLNIGHALAITELYRGDISLFESTFELGEVYRGFYYKFKEYEQCPPIDDELIKLMQPYDMEILKMMDRPQSWRWKYEERMQVYYEHIRFWNYILDLYEINHVIFMNIPHEVFDYVLYCLCEIKGIKKFAFLQMPVFGGRAVITSDFRKEHLKFRKFYEKFIERNEIIFLKDTLEKYEDFRNMALNVYANKEKRWWSGSTTKEIDKYMSYMDTREIFETKFIDKMGRNEFVKLANSHWSGILCRLYYIKHRYKTKMFWRYYESISEKPIKGEKYIYYALHYQPEATSCPEGGGIYVNQMLVIQIISSCLPEGYKLYVKEHPVQTYVGKDRSLYNRIKRIKNTRLITGRIDNYYLIRNAVATATLTGTVAVESVTCGIPCLTFGNFYYNELEGVYFVRTQQECAKAINRIISGQDKINQDKVKCFFQAIFEYSTSLNIGYGNYDEIKTSKEMTQLIYSKITAV